MISAHQLVVRMISLGLVATGIIIFPNWIFVATIPLALGHGLVGQTYQREKGKLPTTLLIQYVALLMALYFFGIHVDPVAFSCFMGLLFCFHFILDEIRFFDPLKKYDFYRVVPFCVLLFSAMYDGAYHTHLLTFGIFCSMILILIQLLQEGWKKYFSEHKNKLVLFWTTTILIAGLATQKQDLVYIHWAYGIILLHYLIWYGEYWFRLNTRKERKSYIVRSTMINVVVLALFYLWVTHSQAYMLWFFFSITGFSVVTIFHILSTAALQLKGKEA